MSDPKCPRCSGVIEHLDVVVFDHGDFYHVRCWRVTESQERVRETKKLTERSKARIRDSQTRFPPPPDA